MRRAAQGFWNLSLLFALLFSFVPFTPSSGAALAAPPK